MRIRIIILTFTILTSFAYSAHSQTIKEHTYPYSVSHDSSKEHTKYGLVSESNNILVKPIYKMIDAFSNQEYNSYAVFKKENKKGRIVKGIISNNGIVVDGIEGDGMNYDGNGKFAVIKRRKNIKIIDITSSDIIFDSDTALLVQIIRADQYFLIMQHRKKHYFYFLDEAGNKTTSEEHQFELFHRWNVNGMPVFRTQYNYKNNRQIDPYGKSYSKYILTEDVSIIPPFVSQRRKNIRGKNYEKKIIETVKKKTLGYTVNAFYEGKKSFVNVKKRGKHALANEQGDLVTECIYDDFIPISTDLYSDSKYDENFIICKYGMKYGLVNTKGELILKAIFDDIDYDYDHKMFYVSIGIYSGYCSMDGKVFLPKECDCL